MQHDTERVSPTTFLRAPRSHGWRRAARPLSVATVTALALTACGGGDGGDGAGADGEQVELTVATFAQPDSVSEAVTGWFYDEVESRSDGRLTFDVTPPDSMCDAAEISVCVQDGRADVGVTIPDYTTQTFPTVSLVSVPFITEDAQALMQTLYEVNMEHEGAQQVWDNNGLHPIGHFSAGRLILGSDDPVNSISDMEGKRWRVAGPYLQRAVEAAGGSNVALTAPETYEGIERGVADAVGFPMDGATEYQLMELLPYWTDPGTGHYTTVGMWMNQDTYEGLPDDLRQIVDEVTAEFNEGAGIEQFNEVTQGQCDVLLENVEEFDAWDAEATAEWRAAIDEDLLDLWVQEAESNGVQDAEGYLALYQEKMGANQSGDTVDPAVECVERFASR